jgi:tRNA-Thr(GGU) m(6)t(6)A37 methyltransferase TsaA
MSELPRLTLEPIGIVRSPFVERSEAPRQASVASDVEGQVLLTPGRGFEDAVSDLELWDYLWLVVWFHHNQGFRPKVQPPRSDKKRGVFATRAPFRPNPIGISAVKLVKVEGLTITVRGLDLLDGTPVLDIKPYVPYSDSIPDAGHGWLEGAASDLNAPAAERPADPRAGYEVTRSELASAQLTYLQAEHGLELWSRIQAALALGPSPHAYRRIRKEADGYVLSVKDWRVQFTLHDSRTVLVERLRSGYKPRELWSGAGEGALLIHRAFATEWP